jgi:hypothetical protein
MNYILIIAELIVLGTPGGANPNGNCSCCAVLAARALVAGVAPVAAAPHSAFNIDGCAATDNAVKKMNILPDSNGQRIGITHRQQVIWTYLERAPDGVYLFEQSEDHVYNFVKHNGQLLLIDTATCLIQLVNTQADCDVVTPAYPADEGGYNYLNPYDDGVQDSLAIWRWGDLNAHYH